MSHHRPRRAAVISQPDTQRNTWVWEPADDPIPASDASLSAAALALPSGPAAPHPGVPAPDAVDRLPLRRMLVHAPLWWVGAHGGAGETTLAALLSWSRAAGHAWPVPPAPAADGAAVRVALVARTSMGGLRAAQRVVTEWASGSAPDVDLLGLVLIADAPGRLPRPLKDFAGVVAGGAPRVWHLPWVESWRLGEDPVARPATRPVRRLIGDVTALVHTNSAAARGAN